MAALSVLLLLVLSVSELCQQQQKNQIKSTQQRQYKLLFLIFIELYTQVIQFFFKSRNINKICIVTTQIVSAGAV